MGENIKNAWSYESIQVNKCDQILRDKDLMVAIKAFAEHETRDLKFCMPILLTLLCWEYKSILVKRNCLWIIYVIGAGIGHIKSISHLRTM